MLTGAGPGTTSTAPWWETPLIAGVAAIIGAAIAFGSSYFSDRRRLDREDRRQWDKEIRDIYVSAAKVVSELREFRWRPYLPHDGNDMTEDQQTEARLRYDKASAYVDDLAALGDQLRLIGSARAIEKMDSLIEDARGIASSFHDLHHPGKHPFVSLHARREELLSAVQENLRLRSYRPYIRPPMSKWTKVRLWVTVRVNPTTSGKLKWWQGRRFYWGSSALVAIAVAAVIWRLS